MPERGFPIQRPNTKSARFKMNRAVNQGDRIRTCDLRLPKPPLYQAELRPEGSAIVRGSSDSPRSSTAPITEFREIYHWIWGDPMPQIDGDHRRGGLMIGIPALATTAANIPRGSGREPIGSAMDPGADGSAGAPGRE